MYLEALRQLEDLFGHRVDLLEADAITNPFLLEAIEQDRIVLCETANGTVMPRNPDTFLHEAATALAAIARYVASKSLEDYERDDLLQAAVERRFEEAGEALNQLWDYDSSLASRLPGVATIVGLRHTLAHGYDDSGGRTVARNGSVWNLAQVLAPTMLKHIEALL